MMSFGRGSRVALACAVAAALVVVPAVAASADDAPSDWWYDGFGVAEAQADGWTGDGVKVAVIDNQINPDLEVFKGAHLTVDDDPLCKGGKVEVGGSKVSAEAIHGSDMVALLVGNGRGSGHVRGIAPDAQVTFYGWGFAHNPDNCVTVDESSDRTEFGDGIARAVADGARIISISQGTTQTTAGDAEALAEALAAGVVVVAATPNSARYNEQWPWSYNGVVSVNAFGQDGKLQEDHEIAGHFVAWKETTVVAPGVKFPSVDWRPGSGWWSTGSSLATPLTAGVLAVTAQKYPDASGDQLIQSLIHNTTPDDHALTRSDTTGYGPVSLRHMLRIDPTTYPDENPLMDKASGVPSAAQVAQAGAQVSPAPSASPTQWSPTATPGALAPTGTALSPWLFVGLGALLVLIVAAVVMIVVVSSNRKKSRNVGGAA